MKKLGTAFATRSNNPVIEILRARERLLVRRDYVHASAEQRRVRLCHGNGRGIVDEHDRVVGAHERREPALQIGNVVPVCVCCGGGGGRRGSEERAPVGCGRDAVGVEGGRFGRGEGYEAEGVRRCERLELAHEFGADAADAYDRDGDGFGISGGEGHGGTNESNERKIPSRSERSFKFRR